jgi:hypothetical protein
MAARHCAAVLDHLEAGTPYERRGFEVGVAAHAVLQAVGEATNAADRALVDAEVERVAGDVAGRLIATGRSFDGVPEPPLVSDHAWHGRDLALQWLAFHPVEPGAVYETGLAASASWQAVPYDSPLARYRGILDVQRVVEDGDEEQVWQTVLVRDYKSAWNDGEEALDSLQVRGYAALASLHHPAARVIRIEVGNLRMAKLWSREITVDEEGAALLRRWRDDLTATMAAYDQPAGRVAVPGIGCGGCPFLGRCVPAREFYAAVDVPDSPEGRARAYAVLEALRGRLREVLEGDTAEGPVELDTFLVGTVAREQRCSASSAPADLWGAWQASRGEALGLLQALDPSVSSMERAVRRLYPNRGDKPMREDLMESLTSTEITRRFGVWPREGVGA